MMKNMRRGIPNLFKDGVKTLTGLEQAVIRNIVACKGLSDITRTSLGPNGMNKMIINHLGKLFVTSDTATIMKEMEIEHPAAKMLVMASAMQEAEIGDGSNFVISIGGELLSQAEELIHMGLHPSEIVTGYIKAGRKALEILDELVIDTISPKEITKESITRACISAIASKQYGYESFIAPLVAEACMTVLPKNTYNFNVDNVRVVKVLGGNLQQSEVIRGMVIPHDTQGSIKRIKDAKVAVFSNSLQAAETETKGTVLIHSAAELMNYNLGEEKEIEKLIKGIADSGINVIVTGGTIDDMAAHFIEKFNMMAIKITSKFELRRICKATKAHPLVNLGPVHPEEAGFCSLVYVREVGSQKLTIFQQDSSDDTNVATILLRASTNNILNDVERAIDDGVNVVKVVGRDGRFLAGAGAVDIELARRLSAYGTRTSGLEQYSIQKFAEALEVVPRTLAENAGLTAMDILSQLYAAHEKGDIHVGVNIDDGGVKDMSVAPYNIIDLLATKKQALKLALDAVVTILRVDQIIQAKPAGGPKMQKGGQHWDEED